MKNIHFDMTGIWSSKENAKKWRKDLADTVNAVNERMGMTENHWEHRSFKEQGLDRDCKKFCVK